MALSVAISLVPDRVPLKIVVEDKGWLVQKLHLPACQWSQSMAQPRAVILGVHGVTLHGKNFDELARYLAARGVLFVAPDLRGFGRWYHGDDEFQSDPRISYPQAKSDLVAVLQALRARYPDLPIFCTGECIGVTLCTRLAGEFPELVNGLILSSAPIKRYGYLTPRALIELGVSLLTPFNQVDMVPHWRSFLSADSRVITDRINDPLTRRFLSLLDLVESNRVCRQTLAYARAVPPSIPALIIQGQDDHLMKPYGAELLLAELGSDDKTLHLISGYGHLLIETAYTAPEIKQLIAGWVQKRIHRQSRHASNLVPFPVTRRVEQV